ncbi:sensor histidine kinase [Nocardioides baculatus]|nr:HAMP domain-containing sensor histidine kinase [Nocardioides baculatus]
MREEDGRTYERPRGQAWGNDAQRAVLHAIAEDVARRSDHRVVAIEVVRSDGHLEFVAIAGDESARDKMLGQASPLELGHILELGVEMEGWRHIAGDRLDEITRAWLDAYGHRPDVPPSELPDGWHPDDQMVRLLSNEDGELRALLYLDEPLSGRRPTTETARTINAESGVLFDAIISIVERELYGEQVRMVVQARRAFETVRPGLPFDELVRELSRALTSAMDVATVDVVAASSVVEGLEDGRDEVAALMQRQWERRGHVVVERQRTWSMQEGAIVTPPALTRLLDTHDLESGLLVPIGAGDEYLATMALGRASGAPRWISSEIHAATMVAADVGRLLLEARLMERERALNAEMRATNEHRRDMVVTLAHELRNPVSVIWSHLELMQHDAPTDIARESLDAMDRAARRVEDMIDALMALAAVSDPDRAVIRASVDLSATVRDSDEFLAQVAERGGVDLVTSAADGVVVLGEEAALQRMVANLFSNAVKYTPAGGRVSVTLEVDDGEAVLTCSDTGIGISEADLPHVFTPFFRSGDPAARDRPGTGLGLSILERVVRAHDGSVDVTSEVGAGTTFVVRLPVAPGDARAEPGAG